MECHIVTRPTLAIVGTGEIAKFHAQAANVAGFELCHIAARPNSTTTSEFSSRFEVPTIWKNPLELIHNSDKWDAIVLASSTSSLLELLEAARLTEKPVLVEKPITHCSKDLKHIVSNTPNVIVGYNRRFYAPIQAAKSFIDAGEPCVIQLQIPETVPFDRGKGGRDYSRVWTNSVHALDLINYLTGVEGIIGRQFVDASTSGMGGVLLLRTLGGHSCSILANWNAPTNFCLTIDRGDERFELKPFESGVLYKGLEVTEPTSESPIRKYVPRVLKQYGQDENSQIYKPGFVAQLGALCDMTYGKRSSIAATIADAVKALEIAESLIG